VDQEIKLLGKQIREQAKGDKNDMVYQSTPGIGPTCARILSNELGDMSQFRNERALFCHTGLTPSEFSSGEKQRKGHITHQGSSRLRWVLTEASWQAVKKDPKLKRDFERIAHRRGKKRAIVAVARKLVGRIRACLRKGQCYELGYGLAA
jgi:transposase